MPSLEGTGGSVVRKCTIGGGSACKIVDKGSSENNLKLSSNDLESLYSIGFKDGLEQGLEKGRQNGDASSFNDGWISCYMQNVLLKDLYGIKLIKDLESNKIIKVEISRDGKNIDINIKNTRDDSDLHILSITLVRNDSKTFIVNAHKLTFRNGNREFLHETTHLDFDSLLEFLITQINRYVLP